MFSWGETTRNGFGLLKVNDLLKHKHNADTGVRFTPPLNPPVTRLSASNKVIVVARKDGKVSIVRIQESQAGEIITSRPKPIQIKEHIWSVSSGDVSVLLLSRGGNVWCLNLKGNASVPKLLDNFQNRKVTQVACGDQHSIALTQDGLVFTWGKNTNGQLGLGYTEQAIIRSPEPIKALSGVPLTQIAAGGDHSFALSLSGTVFGWGHNSAGQLGLGNATDSYTPVPVVCLSLKKAISISCGHKHTAVLTKGGLVFTFGSGCYGQLGHNSLRDELKPRLVAELWGAEVTQISCGRNHTLALVGSSKSKKIYSFGQGQKGQLGNGVKTDQSVPLPVNLSQNGKDDEQICHIFAGGNCSLALCSFGQKSEEKASRPISGIKTLDENTVEMWLSECDNPKSWKRIKRDIKTTFSSPMCLNGSFLDRSLDKHYQTSPRYSGLDMSLARIAFEKLATKDKVLNKIEVVVRDTLLPSLCKDPIGVESLRVFLIVPELLRVLVRQGYGTELTTAVADAILSLNRHKLQILEGLWSRIPYSFFRSAVKTFCTVSAKHLELTDDQYDKHCRSLLSILRVLQNMYDVNSKSPSSLPANIFHIDTVHDTVYLRSKEVLAEYTMMEATRWCNPPSFHQERRIHETMTFYKNAIDHLMAYPCILDTTAKCGFWTLRISELHGPIFFGFLKNELLVDRSTLLQDTFDCLRKKSSDLKVAVTVKFKEENGIDEGGVSMEFFNRIGKELLNTEPPILHVNEYGLAWFSQDDDSVSDEFFLLGLLCGMALYNRCLLNLCFPLVIFKKLLGLDPSIDDMEEMAPTEAQGLQELLKYEEEIVEDLWLDFGWSEGRTLLPNGEMIPVTKVNRQEYVDLYIDMVFNKSVDGQFKQFQKGFSEGCPTHAWEMFLPDELRILLHGDENFKWDELRENAKYEGYISTDEVIQNFWAVFTEFSGDQKKSFLTFLTGAERLSRARLSRLRVTIMVLVTPDPDKHYPLAGTCFETLHLPKYSSIHVLRQKLLHAITYCDVFGNK